MVQVSLFVAEGEELTFWQLQARVHSAGQVTLCPACSGSKVCDWRLQGPPLPEFGSPGSQVPLSSSTVPAWHSLHVHTLSS